MVLVKGAYRPIRYSGCNRFKRADEGLIAAGTLSRWSRSSSVRARGKRQKTGLETLKLPR